MTASMKSYTTVSTVTLSPNPIQAQEAILIDVRADNRTTWGEYATLKWSQVSGLIWG